MKMKMHKYAIRSGKEEVACLVYSIPNPENPSCACSSSACLQIVFDHLGDHSVCKGQPKPSPGASISSLVVCGTINISG